ncbi:hypothetical protein KDK_81190 [Dictyobacter kobayashii]|uniref:Glycosyltransferase RgtA/B/C/D-like domain-containing protein n=1 Tax=Dictyobacter kobayashii TaxID=2014872 RepID=A0A402AYY3_9CHLR|nr:hypothetical protein KDK_81190 [Dictyobacter kobayashii]
MLSINIFNLPLIIAGLIFYFRSSAGKAYRALGWAFIVLYLLFTITNAKPYFLAPAYPFLLSGGAVICEQAWRKWLKRTYVIALSLSGLLFAPMALPMLPPATFEHTYSVLTAAGNGGAGQHSGGIFPQYLGDRFGWEEMAQTLARATQQLPAGQRAQACIYASNYGEASALTFYRATYHLPPVISGHNNYYLWGPGQCSGTVLITIGEAPSFLQQEWSSVKTVDTYRCHYCIAAEDQLPVTICTQPKFSGSLSHIWSRLKFFG